MSLAAPVQKPEFAWSHTESCIQRISKSSRPAIVGNKRLAHATNSLEADAALEEDNDDRPHQLPLRGVRYQPAIPRETLTADTLRFQALSGPNGLSYYPG